MGYQRTGKNKTCPQCKKEFYVKKSQLSRRKYCCKKCQRQGEIKKCLICKNEFYIKKVHLSGEYPKKYCSRLCFSKAMIGKRAWNKDLGFLTKKTYKAPSTTINGKTIALSHIIWCSQPGNPKKVPKGYVIHHIDGNPKNNKPLNLKLMDRIEHHKLHNKLFKLRRIT